MGIDESSFFNHRAGEIVCECVKEVSERSPDKKGFSLHLTAVLFKQGGRLRIRPVTAGYNQSWNVQFPSNLREEGLGF